MQPVLAHEVEPSLTYEDVLAKLARSNGDSIEQRFEIGKLCSVALDRMNIGMRQLSEDTGFSQTTLKKYMDAWNFWGEYRIPGHRVVWSTYIQHLAFDRILGPAWMSSHDYRERLLEGGRTAADEMWSEYWAERRDHKDPITPEAQRTWRIRGATQALWNARCQLQLIDWKTLSPEERQRFADHFKALIGYSQEFRRAVEDR